MGGIIKRYLGRLVSHYIPKPTKRMLVLAGVTTVIGKLIPSDRRDIFVADLNKKMELAVKQESINFALEVGKMMWHDLTQQYLESKIEQQILVNKIYNDCPTSLRYADEDIMKKDIREAILFAEGWI